FPEILFGFLSGAGLYSIIGLILFFIARVVSFVFQYFKIVFLVVYIILFTLTFMLLKNKKVFKYSYLITALLFLLIYIFTNLI
ncbi:MAG: hypothetical protein AABY22_11555, partial [Nanoarchaeota archaeon]